MGHKEWIIGIIRHEWLHGNNTEEGEGRRGGEEESRRGGEEEEEANSAIISCLGQFLSVCLSYTQYSIYEVQFLYCENLF